MRLPRTSIVFLGCSVADNGIGFNQRDADRNGNCKPGTVVDTGIVVKQEFAFVSLYLFILLHNEYIIYVLINY